MIGVGNRKKKKESYTHTLPLVSHILPDHLHYLKNIKERVMLGFFYLRKKGFLRMNLPIRTESGEKAPFSSALFSKDEAHPNIQIYFL